MEPHRTFFALDPQRLKVWVHLKAGESQLPMDVECVGLTSGNFYFLDQAQLDIFGDIERIEVWVRQAQNWRTFVFDTFHYPQRYLGQILLGYEFGAIDQLDFRKACLLARSSNDPILAPPKLSAASSSA